MSHIELALLCFSAKEFKILQSLDEFYCLYDSYVILHDEIFQKFFLFLSLQYFDIVFQTLFY